MHPLKAQPPPLDQRGVTLQTVIILAVLALGATGGGIVIYNVIGQRSGDVEVNTQSAFFWSLSSLKQIQHHLLT